MQPQDVNPKGLFDPGSARSIDPGLKKTPLKNSSAVFQESTMQGITPGYLAALSSFGAAF